jgi:hypothetical protein
MSLQCNIPVQNKMAFHLHLDAFNTFNRTQFSGLNAQVNFSSIANATVTNFPLAPAKLLRSTSRASAP